MYGFPTIRRLSDTSTHSFKSSDLAFLTLLFLVDVSLCLVESKPEIRHVLLLKHRRDVYRSLLSNVWYSSSRESESRIAADLQNLLNIADDLLAAKKDAANVVTLGDNMRVERMTLGTLLIICQYPHTCGSCRAIITESSSVLQKRTFSIHLFRIPLFPFIHTRLFG